MAKAEPRSITRRSLVAAFALPVIPALPVAAIPSLPVAAQEPDPIFAVIADHVRAYREFNVVLDALAVAETEAWRAPRGQRRAANKRLTQAYAAERQFGDRESDAVARLVATVPQTLHGAAAVLAYVREHFEQGYPMCERSAWRCSARSNARFATRPDCRVPRAMRRSEPIKFFSQERRFAWARREGAPLPTLRSIAPDHPFPA